MITGIFLLILNLLCCSTVLIPRFVCCSAVCSTVLIPRFFCAAPQ